MLWRTLLVHSHGLWIVDHTTLTHSLWNKGFSGFYFIQDDFKVENTVFNCILLRSVKYGKSIIVFYYTGWINGMLCRREWCLHLERNTLCACERNFRQTAGWLEILINCWLHQIINEEVDFNFCDEKLLLKKNKPRSLLRKSWYDERSPSGVATHLYHGSNCDPSCRYLSKINSVRPPLSTDKHESIELSLLLLARVTLS